MLISMVLDQKGIDEWFDTVTKGMNDLHSGTETEVGNHAEGA